MPEKSSAGQAQQAADRFIDALVPHVPFDGWSREAIDKAASETGIRPESGFVPPTRPTDAIRLWSDVLDRRMLDSLAGDIDQVARVRDKVILGVRRRIDLMSGQQEAARRATVMLALPPNGYVAAGCLHRTVDRIWYAAGDTSTDHNYYTKRGLLAPVYVSTLLYWLNDASEGQQQTWAFLERRIDGVLSLPRTLGSLRDRLPRFGSPFEVFRQFRDRRPWTYRG